MYVCNYVGRYLYGVIGSWPKVGRFEGSQGNRLAVQTSNRLGRRVFAACRVKMDQRRFQQRSRQCTHPLTPRPTHHYLSLSATICHSCHPAAPLKKRCHGGGRGNGGIVSLDVMTPRRLQEARPIHQPPLCPRSSQQSIGDCLTALIIGLTEPTRKAKAKVQTKRLARRSMGGMPGPCLS